MGFGYTKAVYETFMGRKDLLNATQLSVLLALAYSANNTTGACYPGKARLGQLTLLGQSTVDQACRELKNKNIITIDERRVDARYNKTNVYTFPFLTWNRETRYQTVQQSATPQQLPPPAAGPPPPGSWPTLPR